jgi:hypothetical protein
MSVASAQIPSVFVRRTTLNEHERRVNFKQIDNDVIRAITSAEAREVTPQMATIYLTLLAAPSQCWERAGVLHFVGEEGEAGRLTAWEQMRHITGVANSTLSKALDWMRRKGVIGYDARANGIGIRVFFNRAASSIRRDGAGQETSRCAGERQGERQRAGQGSDRWSEGTAQKFLRIFPTPSPNVPTPTSGAPFREGKFENIRENYFPRASAREGAAVENSSFNLTPSESPESPDRQRVSNLGNSQDVLGNALTDQAAATAGRRVLAGETRNSAKSAMNFHSTTNPGYSGVDAKVMDTLTRKVADALRPEIDLAVRRETEDAREWFLKYGLPKATRVAQRETYDLLRAQGVIAKKSDSARVGQAPEPREQGREGKREADRVAGFLSECCAAIRRAEMNAEKAGKRELSLVLRSVAEDLDALRDQVLPGAMSAPEEIASQLETLDIRVREATWKETDERDREELLQSARQELKGYSSRMDPTVFADTVRRRAAAGLRERLGIPPLSLFYA